MSPSLHLHPINVVVYNDPQKSNLVAGFVLRCFQHLSDPDLDTRNAPAAQPQNQRSVQHGPLVLVSEPQISYAHDR